ncbi:MAG: Ribosomal large subunit pseudouridine synthase D [Candidatus Magasanikbacteria bacterium GW2011_GWA2_46_17]|uniref:Ribosomal large subunit pseudouridine synthase D n=1 Tax=Candidatus Magasanikbacteria bacterium GW2011_GWA2_46_17 TaxID=1619042 RepID=A0A0G1P3J1_9BACT|nr:MAG: Ribosomal large subunit pseudouridine synthase D [Candidatus Magasanikbacteria bacterium GW2011_GWA2_46_17]
MPTDMTNLNAIAVNAKQAGDRLDIFLSKELQISRSRAQKMIERELITVNGKLPKKAGDRVAVDDEVTVSSRAESRRDEAEGSLNHGERDSSTPRPGRVGRNDNVTVIIETSHYIVVDKPSGMLTHPTEAGEKDTLANFLVEKYPEIKNVGDRKDGATSSHPPPPSPSYGGHSTPLIGGNKHAAPHVRPGIVHRLDREASGLLVVARTQEMFEHLKKQFKDRTVEKEYLALVHGKVPVDWGELTFPITRSRGNERMAALPLTKKGVEHEEGKKALTEFTVEKHFVNFTLARVKLHTGRMHQIRVHFFAYGHSLVGDPLYYTKKQKRAWDNKLGRLFLHSARLGFTDLDGERKVFESTLPKELEEFLKELR